MLRKRERDGEKLNCEPQKVENSLEDKSFEPGHGFLFFSVIRHSLFYSVVVQPEV